MRKKLNFTLFIFAIIYILISLVNHYNFRTNTLDLGAYTNALYDYANFNWNDSSTFKAENENLLADHFDLYLILFSTLIFLFGTYTLLIVQIISILLGALGVYKLLRLDSEKTAYWATLYFLSFFGVFSAVSFDYHSNTVASMLIPWLFYYFKTNKINAYYIIFFFILIAKENMSLFVAFIALGLLFENFKNQQKRKVLLITFLASFIWFLAITHWIMPMFSNNGTYPHFHYSSLGNSMLEVVFSAFKNPIEAIKMLFINHNNAEFGDYVKIELWIFLLLSGLFWLLKKPAFLIMLIPVFFQKLWHDNPQMWGVNGQYSIEFAPILTIGIFYVLNTLQILRNVALTFTIILSFAASIRLMDNTTTFTNKAQIRFYQLEHYKRDFDVEYIHQKLNEIPEKAVVSSQSALLPHLALRPTIYNFPIIKDAEFIIYCPMESPYPLKPWEFDSIISLYKNSNDWKVELDNKNLLVLIRK